LQIFTDRNRKWWITFAVRMPEQPEPDASLPVAVLGIDLGIEKAACTSLVTPKKVRETKFFVQEDKVTNLKKYDRLVAELQHELGTRKDKGVLYDGVAKKLRTLRGKRENVAREYDRVLVRQLLDYISELSEKYTLYVSLGRIKNIRFKARRGNRAGRSFRGMLHSWAFARISLSIRHGLAQLGWSVDGKDSRFQAVSESWTSIMCWKCGRKGVRPKQKLFICPTCGNKCNADMNGAINIAGRLITLTSSLHGVRGQGKWASAIARSRRPKARRKKSDGKSLLSERESSSEPGESAAVHTAQTSLLSFSDGTGMSDDDPAVENIVGDLSVAEGDASAVVQEKEAGSSGGIASR
ncbi:MAG: zinc ribbon domain-containing protein, partial [Candidatus Thorarchaeota archaeon]